MKRLIISLSIFCALQCEQLPLPANLANKAVYYFKTEQLELFSCGYNALFNACNFEHHCCFLNKYHKYNEFKNRILPYIEQQGRHPRNASSNLMTEHCARELLDTRPLYHLFYKKEVGRAVPLLSYPISISFKEGTSKAELDRRLEKAYFARQNAVYQDIQKFVLDNPFQSCIVHFLCYVQAQQETHGILISLYQHKGKRGLYLFDNMNMPIHSNSESYLYIEQLCKDFAISKRSAFEGPNLPHRWPHLD